MKITLDNNTIQSINLFQTLTGTSIVDCIDDEDVIYFIVGKGQHGFAVGRAGAKIKNAERVFKKSIRIFEYSPDLKTFVKNAIPECQEIVEKDNKEIQVKVRPTDRAKVIGRSGKNIKIINRFLEHIFGACTIKVK